MADEADNPVLRNANKQKVDQLGTRFVDETGKLQQKVVGVGGKREDTGSSQQKGPAGGFDSTPVPNAPPGYTLKFTFHRADNLPFADFNTLSSDPYIIATLRTQLAKRHKQDPDLRIRTPTIHRNTDPVWNTEWTVANVPSSGFFLKCRLYDEDPADHDDRLGNAHIDVPRISEDWPGFREKKFGIKKRMASKRAYTLRGCAALFSKNVKMGGDLIVSVENMGRTKDEHGGRAYTVGPLPWSRHFSPLIGRLAGTKDEEENEKDGKPGVEKYNFQAVQIQLAGPVPEELYHRYVEFKPFVAGMFTSHSVRGRILNRALHHQHARIYNYDRATKYGVYQEPCEDLTKMFLDFVRYDNGGRIFTYVLSLDGLWRFTETGKQFGIDLLSKHTMHSDVSIYIAFSGEFFIRRLRHPHRSKSATSDPDSQVLPPAPEDGPERSHSTAASEPSKDPSMYEMVIDNDSGTYRPNAEKLPLLKAFMAANLPGLRVITLDSQADAEKMGKMKDEQRERKKNKDSGQQITYLQNSSQSSVSSSDEEKLDAIESGGKRQHHHQNKLKNQMHKHPAHGLGGRDQVSGESSKPLDEKQAQTQSDNTASYNDGAVQLNSTADMQQPSSDAIMNEKTDQPQHSSTAGAPWHHQTTTTTTTTTTTMRS